LRSVIGSNAASAPIAADLRRPMARGDIVVMGADLGDLHA